MMIRMEQIAQNNTVYRITWTESESGWGQRPDGATLHASLKDAVDFIAQYWADEHARNPSGDVPECYSRPDYDPTTDTVPTIEINDETYQQVIERGSMWEPTPVTLGA